jgi:hypothetical protein
MVRRANHPVVVCIYLAAAFASLLTSFIASDWRLKQAGQAGADLGGMASQNIIALADVDDDVCPRALPVFRQREGIVTFASCSKLKQRRLTQHTEYRKGWEL